LKAARRTERDKKKRDRESVGRGRGEKKSEKERTFLCNLKSIAEFCFITICFRLFRFVVKIYLCFIVEIVVS